jgi:sugar transferase (PEP-CTERM/EpsH1 system associated)
MNVLFLTHRLPYAPNRGDRIRAYHLLREMSRFAEVSVFSLVHDAEEAGHAAEVPGARTVKTARVPHMSNMLGGVLRLPTSRPLTHSLLSAPGVGSVLASIVRERKPDLVVAYCSGMARFALSPPLADLPLVLDMVDVDSEKWRELGARTSGPMGWVYARESRTLASFEQLASGRAKAVLVVSERERAALQRRASGNRIEVLGNGIDVEAFAAPGEPADSGDVVFCGVMDYAPNIEAVTWFLDRVWPSVRAARPDARFVVVGANPPAALVDRARRDASMHVTGRVEHVQPHLWRAAVSVAPLQLARGLQNKVLEALSAGLPVVATSTVVAGLPPGIDRGCVEADEPTAFANALVALLEETPARRRAIAEGSGIARCTWAQELRPLEGILKAALA